MYFVGMYDVSKEYTASIVRVEIKLFGKVDDTNLPDYTAS
jgi:hypothetical protein